MEHERGDEPLKPPERVGPYRIESRLGQGGMGAVYRAYDQRLERPVAIKQLLPEMEADDRARRRLRREARAVASLNHPSIVQIFDIVEEEAGDWIVMELVEGETLHRLIEQGQVDLPQALALSREVAEGLAEAHAKGIVHRDLKTENVMVNLSGHAKILDFGLAKQVLKGTKISDGSLSIQGTILGTGRSMSPEQAMGDPVDHRSDLFSLGTLLYEAAVGELPFKGASIFHTLARICTEAHPPAMEVNPAISYELSELIDRLLEKDPERRPATASEVARELEELEEGLRAKDSAGDVGPDPGSGPTPMAEVGSEESRTFGLPGAPRGVGTNTERPLPSSTLFRGAESSTGISIKTLLWISVVDRVGVVTSCGETRSYEIFGRHDRLVRDLLGRFDGLEIEKSEGFLILFVRPIDAILYALEYHRELAQLAQDLGVSIGAQAGIHLGEVFVRENLREDVTRGAKPLEVEGEAKRMTSGVAALARRGQTLITQATLDMARRALEQAKAGGQELRWESYGLHVVPGVLDPLEIGEVGIVGEGPFLAPSEQSVDAAAPRRRHLLGLLAAMLFILLLALALFRFQPRPDTASTPAPRPGLVVLGFKNFSGVKELEWLGTALAEMLSNELSAGGELRPVPGESVSRMRRDLELATIETLSLETLEKVREMVGARYLVLGSYTGGGEQAPIHLTLQLQQTTDGELKTRKVDAADLFALVTEAGGVLREMLELEALSAGAEEAVRASMGANEEAARLYVEGLVHLRSFDAVAARAALGQAIESDAGFALAHAALSDVYQFMGYESEAVDSALHASELTANLTREQQLWIEARYHEAAGSWAEAIKTWQALWEFWPDDLEYGLRLARAQTTAGRGQEAIMTLQALRQLPTPAGDDPRIDLEEAKTAASMLAWRQQADAATRARQKGLERNARSLVAEAELLRGGALYQINELSEAEKSLGEAQLLFEASGDEVKMAQVGSSFANLRQTQGRADEARRLFEGALEIHKKVGNRKGQAEVENDLAFLIQDAGDFSTAEAGLRRALKIAREIGARHDEAQYTDTLTWVLLGQSRLEEAERSAREVLRLYDEIGSAAGKAWAHFYLGQVALARGELEVAQKAHEAALLLAERIDDGYVAGFVLDGLAKLALTRDDLTTAESHATDGRVVASEILPWVYLARGDVSRARATARLVSSFHGSQGNLVSQAEAEVALAAALRAEGEKEQARRVLERWRETMAQKPPLRLRAQLLEIQLGAAELGLGPALARIEAVGREATDLGLEATVLEARLAAGQLELAVGRTGSGRQHLAQLADQAEDAGYRLLARQARLGESFRPERN